MNLLFDSVGKAALLTLYSWRESDLNKGQSHRMSGVYQSREMAIAAKSINTSLQIPLPYPPLFKAIPIAIGLSLAHLNIEEPNIRDVAYFFANNIGKIALIAFAISSIALTALGHPLVGLLSLLTLIAGQNNHIKRHLKPYALSLFILAAIMGGGICEQSVAALHLLLLIRPYITATYHKLKNAPPPKPPEIDPLINRAHFTEVIEEPDLTDPPDLLELFDEATFIEIPKRATLDPRLRGGESIFEKLYNYLSGIEGRREIRFLRRGLNDLLSSSLSPIAQRHLNHLAAKYKKTKNTKILVELALDANVCPGGKDEAIRDIFMTYVHQNSLPLNTQILLALREYRFTHFQAAYIESIPIASWNAVRLAVDFQNRHVFNTAINTCTNLGLPELGASDDTIALDEATKAVLTPFFANIERQVMGQYRKELILPYLAQTLREELKKAIEKDTPTEAELNAFLTTILTKLNVLNPA